MKSTARGVGEWAAPPANSARSPKRPKIEPNVDDDEVQIIDASGGAAPSSGGLDDPAMLKQQEKALATKIEIQETSCKRLKEEIALLTTELEEEEKNLSESKTKLIRIRMHLKLALACAPARASVMAAKAEPEPEAESFRASVTQQQQGQQVASKPKLVIPPYISKNSNSAAYGGGRGMINPAGVSQEREQEIVRERESGFTGSGGLKPSFYSRVDSVEKATNQEQNILSDARNGGRSVGPTNKKADIEHKADGGRCSVPMNKKADRNPEFEANRDLIQSVCTRSSAKIIEFEPGTVICSQHKRKLRCLEFSPVNHHQFVTSALDGSVHLWQTQPKRSTAVFVSSSPGLSPQMRWPEDLAWHPDGNSIFAVYHADGGDSQISILNMSRDRKVNFLEEKPHRKGIINSISFMPWDEICFTTGGCDHAVVFWQETVDSWKSSLLHGSLHTSAVMGVAGLSHKKIILSAGADKRVVAFDMQKGRCDFKLQLESKCMSVLPNPCDFNLVMVQTGEHKKQLRLYDIRSEQTAIHSFGWMHDSKQQSALIGQAWSPDGLYLSSGSADPTIHIFDIRYNGQVPSQSLRGHQKRVFKAEWHKSLPLLVSISSDLNIGFHQMI